MRQAIEYFLALYRAPGVGAVTFARMLQQVESPAQWFEDVGLRQDLPDKLRAYLISPDWAGVEQDLAWAQGDGRGIISCADPEYPASLSDLTVRPPLIFWQGDASLLHRPQLAVVGSRNPTADGADNAFAFAKFLAAQGLVITSGLAQGIDAAAHRGALAAGGATIAVMGTGLDRVYPAANRALAHQIVNDGGLLVSEFVPGTPVLRENFPRRNALISGLSLGVLVVEAARGSGSLITAKLAGEQGREVFAVPGSIHNPLARGCHQLIRQGAKLVETAEDIFEEWQGYLRTEAQPAAPMPEAALPALDPEYQHLLSSLGYDPQPVDQLVERCGLTADAVCSMLLVLELQGLVHASSGGRYSRAKV
ncbi:MAG: DNA-processing protein DprA [Gammaproteobacteria bacterium]|nr:DNA-processing protein DprA [Gammaproteobacteria bacterium]